jgi:hypothetical protein
LHPAVVTSPASHPATTPPPWGRRGGSPHGGGFPTPRCQ